jgi:AcrR family transcriptional regulator
MSTTGDIERTVLMERPKRADARLNYEKLLAAARAAFTENDKEASLEDIARRAGVGIGTLYRHFPTRQNLIEAVYVGEVEALSRSAQNLADLPPWEALARWLRRYVEYVRTKQALADELFAIVGPGQEVFTSCRSALCSAGRPLLERAQQAGVVRTDVGILDVLHLVSGIAKINTPDPEQVDRILEVALDGLRQSAAAPA